MEIEHVQAAAKGYRIPAYKRLIPRYWLKIVSRILIFGTVVGSFLPGSTKEAIGTHAANHQAFGHRLFHVVCFGLIAASLLFLAERLRDELKAVVFVSALGVFIEATQYGIRLSSVFEWWDVRDDLSAVAVVFVLVQVANILTSSKHAQVS